MKKLLLAASFAALALCGCSLRYNEPVSATDTSPELEFSDVNYKRYEDRKITAEVTAETLEQYRDTNEAYAQNAHFRSWDDEQNLVNEGECFLLGADSENEIYTLFSNINIENMDQNFSLRAQNLKWDGKNQKLTSGKDDTIFIRRDDVEFQGQGFTADGITHTFTFESQVSGTITTQDNGGSSDE